MFILLRFTLNVLGTICTYLEILARSKSQEPVRKQGSVHRLVKRSACVALFASRVGYN